MLFRARNMGKWVAKNVAMDSACRRLLQERAENSLVSHGEAPRILSPSMYAQVSKNPDRMM